MADRVVPFRFSVKPSGQHGDHVLLEVDSLTGEAMFGPPLEPHERAAVTSNGFPAKLDNRSLTQLVIVLLDEVGRLRRRLEA